MTFYDPSLTDRDVPLRHYTMTDVICPACRRARMVALLGADNRTMYLNCTGGNCTHTVRAVDYLRHPVATQPSLFAAAMETAQ